MAKHPADRLCLVWSVVVVVFSVAGLASLGLPTTSGFIAEFLVFVGSFASKVVAGIGVKPATEFVYGVPRNPDGSLTVDPYLRAAPDLYAAGDICGPPWQVAKAVGEGCVAGLEAAAYAKKK